MRWWAVIPIKDGRMAKSRFAHLDTDQRLALARAMAQDTVRATLDCPRVDGVIIVGAAPEGLVPGGSVASPGSVIGLADPGTGLNDALRAGAEAVPHGAASVLVLGDLPCATPEALDAALTAAAGHDRAFIADVAGTGTTLLTARPGVAPQPAFGHRSRARHAASGAVEIDDPQVAPLQRDVDSDVDLWDAERRGVGPVTQALLAQWRGQ